MPCSFISSCFFLESAWNRSPDDPDCAVSNTAANDPANPDAANAANGHWIQAGGNAANDGQEQPNMAGGGAVGVASNPAAASGNGTTVSATTANEKVPKVVKTFRAYLPSCHRTYSCVHCRAHLANHDELISKSFQGSQGRAYLFNSVVNVGCGPAEERILLTGLHAVADIYCDCCKTTLGWKYEQAFESSQKYKEGKFIIELAHMIKENGWENES